MSTPSIWFKSQRVLRTIVQAAVVLFPVVNGVAAAAAAYLHEQADVTIPGWVFVVLNGVVAATALVMGLVARIMAVPGVNDLLVRVGLGSVPKSYAAKTDEHAPTVTTIVQNVHAQDPDAMMAAIRARLDVHNDKA